MTRLRYERKLRRWSQHHVAHAVQINQPFISLIERGRFVPTESQLLRLADYFDIPPDELLKEVVVVKTVVA